MAPKASYGPEGQLCDLTESRGVNLYYETSGPLRRDWQGEREEILFLLLGSTADLRKTTDQQYVLGSVGFFKVLTYDHRNTGRSTIKDEPCTMQDYADDAAAFLEAVIPEGLPVFVLGVSFGGMVAQHLAIRHPHLVKKLVLCCSPAGGPLGGMSYPIHEWYAPGVSVESRVVKKIFQASTARDEQWKEKNASEWEMVYALLTRDEKVGASEPLRMEGIKRQLEARQRHDTWDQLSMLKMDVLCCGSPLDNITPVALLQRLVERIGSNCDAKLDFDGGHAFAAADATALPFINGWLRSQRPGASSSVWKVIGGSDKGGILVRKGPAMTDPAEEERLSTGALVEELEAQGERLHFRLLEGTGPREGWVLVKLKGKDLVVRNGS
ncbi:unnamed protein product [Polarella glacialis]|uniref:Serine aminopeptidase S33 domain-containing protein n=1 Tax=Polarella glacialis TaxID=89957 RepID=A0A813GWJ0_POLGL|nr:unnamed protein product [Polarella glacialis]CAE8647211.1 unnamed protein product [Polarella glacialis]